MIKNLVIDNIALIDHLDIDFSDGLTAVTGETGSGKSIIIDSLAFVLGDRADKTLIKYGTDYAEVSALFEVKPDSPVIGKLKEYGYSDDAEILLNRKMSLAGKNEIRIQGKTATLAILKDICAELVDIFGQGQHLALLNPKNQLSVLDAFCNFDTICTQLENDLAPQLAKINRELKSFGGSDAERERLIDILKFQIDEIVVADIGENEEDELLAMHKRMVNIEKITSAIGQANNLLSAESGAISQTFQAVNLLKNISPLENEAESLANQLQTARLDLEDVAASLENILQATDFSEYDVDRTEERLEKIRQIKRKYGGTMEDVRAFLRQAQIQYDNLVNATERIEQLNSDKNNVLRQMYKLALEKSELRKAAALKLSQDIKRELDDLGMKGTQFEVEFCDVPSFEDYCRSPAANGFDSLEFLMSANVGEPLKPLAKVISGGEMSRFMLAVKNITALAEKIPTMVFDEIDAGISGNMAQMVATKLANVSNAEQNGYQCIVITHLPQIAAMADDNFLIEKRLNNGKTNTVVTRLSNEQRRAEEVARLMGAIGNHALANARELLDWSAKYKNTLAKRS